MNFALLISLLETRKSKRYTLESQNEGIPEADMILIVEAWLEKVRDTYKRGFKDGLRFGNTK